MIYTITLNPSIDYVVQTNDVNLGKLNYATNETKEPGGKGINVSRVLTRFNVANTAIGFIGGFTGDYVKERLDKEYIAHEFVQVSEETRINIKLKGNEETEINGVSPTITDKDWESFLLKLNQIKENDIVVLAGSIPSSLPKETYETIINMLKDRQVKIVLDAKGDVLKKTISKRPFLIKPNQHELEEYFETTIQTQEELITYGKQLIKEGAQHVIISLAGDGALFFESESVYVASAPKGSVVNSVGAGDSLVAGFLAHYVQTGNKVSAFQHGIACGSATAFSIGLCEKKQVEALVSTIDIKKLS